MSREWEPGDVRLATVNGEQMLVLRGRGIFEGNWYTQGPVAGSRLSVTENWLLDDRPLVVIDPEDRDAVERLLSLLADALNWAPHNMQRESYRNPMQAALREYANPKPPRIDEPGTWAVVEASCVHDDTPRRWVKFPGGNWHTQVTFGQHRSIDNPDDWDSLIDPVLVRDGVDQ